MSILVAIIGLSILVIFHEFGHFLAAKLCGVGVLEFSVGMGPRLFSHVWHNTRYSFKTFAIRWQLCDAWRGCCRLRRF